MFTYLCLLMMSYLCNCAVWMMSCLCACSLWTVSHWLPCVMQMSCRFTYAWVMTGRDALEGRSGGTWLPAGFLAPLSWRHHSSARTAKKMPGHSEEVKKLHLMLENMKTFIQFIFNHL